MDDRCEFCDTMGHLRDDSLLGSSLLPCNEKDYGSAVEKAGTTRDYTFTMFSEGCRFE